jgi:hypothetical protein
MNRPSALQFPLSVALFFVTCAPLVAETQPKGATPLAEAIKSFDEMAAKDPIGKEQPPLTEDEIIAAIQWWKSHRERMRVSDGGDFHAFVKIAETRQLPVGWKIEVLSGLLDDDPFTFEAWSVGLSTRPDERGSIYTFQLPGRTVRPRLIGDLERKVIEKWHTPEIWHNPGFPEKEYYRERQAAAEKDRSIGSALPTRSGDAGARQMKLEAATKAVLSAHHFSPTQIIQGSNGLVWAVGTRVQCWSGFVIAIAKMTANGGVTVEMAGVQFVGSAWAKLGRLFMEKTNKETAEIQAQIQEQVNR